MTLLNILNCGSFTESQVYGSSSLRVVCVTSLEFIRIFRGIGCTHLLWVYGKTIAELIMSFTRGLSKLSCDFLQVF